jgi:hypothetical protein
MGTSINSRLLSNDPYVVDNCQRQNRAFEPAV